MFRFNYIPFKRRELQDIIDSIVTFTYIIKKNRDSRTPRKLIHHFTLRVFIKKKNTLFSRINSNLACFYGYLDQKR